ncbi:MAG: YkgJ family cysteine cluster protein [Thermodesulfobacteriota bacterium]
MSTEKDLFNCRQCGHCCHGATTVSLDDADLARLLRHLRLERRAAEARYLRVTGGVVQMQTRNGACIFYNQGCTIHPAKPWRCRQWPLHPSILADEANLSAIRASCPGLNQDLDYQELCQRLATALAGETPT